MEPLFCRNCRQDITTDGFTCSFRLCPLDEFVPAGEIELGVPSETKPAQKARKYYIFSERIELETGGPAPSETNLSHV